MAETALDTMSGAISSLAEEVDATIKALEAALLGKLPAQDRAAGVAGLQMATDCCMVGCLLL